MGESSHSVTNQGSHVMQSNTNIFRVGICGYSAQKFNEDKARSILLANLIQLKEQYGDKLIVVSGMTWQGVPGIGYEVASALDLHTVGIACVKAKSELQFPCDAKYFVGEDWPDASETFIDNIDLLIRIGGGKISHKEAELAKDQGIDTIEYEMEVKK